MYRYFVLAWNAADPRRGAAARLISGRLQAGTTQWTRRIERRGLAVFDSGTRPGSSETWILPDERGALFGKVFSRADSERPSTRTPLDVRAAADACAAGPRAVLERHWGRYIAIVENPAAASLWVLRDPSATLPCFITAFRGVHVFFSDLEDCLALGLLSFSVNWDYVAAIAASCALQVRETGLNEVSEVLPGECVAVQGDALHRTLVWNPVEVAQREPIECVEDAVARLHHTTFACVRAWSSCYEGVLHSLSGGLDSSIVLSCLAHAPQRSLVTALNYYAAGPDEDERRYARLAADRTGVPLIERQLTADEVKLERILEVRRAPRPGYYVAALQRQRLESGLAREIGATGIFSGGGGDAIFYQGRADLAIADFVQRHGLRRGIWPVAMDVARITGLAVWPLIRRGLRTALLKPAWQPFEGGTDERRLVNPQAIRASRNDPRWRQPWLQHTEGVPHGKLWHALSLSVSTGFYEAFDEPDDPERTYPLVSQPLIELCLRIPTYVLVAGGWDRAIARRAFANELPPEIVQRRAKGTINTLSTRILDANVAFAREMLLDGYLVREGILDRARLAAALSGRAGPADLEYNAILHEYLSIEAWLRRSLASQARAAA